MTNVNVGTFLYKIVEGLIHFTKTLYDIFTTEISMQWLVDLLDFFNVSVNFIPSSISLTWILTGASGAVLFGIIVYNIFKV